MEDTTKKTEAILRMHSDLSEANLILYVEFDKRRREGEHYSQVAYDLHNETGFSIDHILAVVVKAQKVVIKYFDDFVKDAPVAKLKRRLRLRRDTTTARVSSRPRRGRAKII